MHVHVCILLTLVLHPPQHTYNMTDIDVTLLSENHKYLIEHGAHFRINDAPTPPAQPNFDGADDDSDDDSDGVSLDASEPRLEAAPPGVDEAALNAAAAAAADTTEKTFDPLTDAKAAIRVIYLNDPAIAMSTPMSDILDPKTAIEVGRVYLFPVDPFFAYEGAGKPV